MRFFLLLFFPFFLFANDYLSELKQIAIDKNISQMSEWQSLLGFRQSLFGKKSVIDDERFFFAADGKTDPEAELQATIDSFFAGHFENNSSIDSRCVFTARYDFLKRALPIDETRLAPVECDGFDLWYRSVSGDRLIITFSAAYMNNPASMFGHSFLRIDKHDKVNPLTSYSLNYAAKVPDEENGLLFIVRGLLGGYEGYFSVIPYAEKAKEYANQENRDMWEYELNFTRAEIDKMLLHAWELHFFYRDYYFLRENCSFVLLELLEYAKPELHLSDRFGIYAAPIDTVRDLVQTPNMLRRAEFRPSLNTRITAAAKELDDHTAAIALARGTVDPQTVAAESDRKQAAKSFDLALSYLEYLYNSDAIDGETYKKRDFRLMSSRATLGRSEPPTIVPPARPDSGHRISRLAIGGGYDSSDHASANLRIRPAYHDLVDPIAGFSNGSGISAFDLWLEHSDDRSFVRRFTLLNVESYTPRSQFFSPISWRFGASYESQNRGDRLVSASGGAGFSWGGERALLYLLGETELGADKRLHKGYELYAGGAAGALFSPASWWRSRAEIAAQWDASNEWAWRRQAKVEQSFTIGANKALRLETSHTKTKREEFNEALLFIDLFF
ncbi:hypothetical protein AGMMS50229_19090 [Campylobacterota bacterium]|nr:hypothetical protein AGMMS50229_19090 [Campylobacterota bacterium]